MSLHRWSMFTDAHRPCRAPSASALGDSPLPTAWKEGCIICRALFFRGSSRRVPHTPHRLLVHKEMSADADVVASALADVLDTHGYRESCMPLTTMPSIAGGPPTGDEYMAANLPPGCTSEASILLQLFLLGKRIDTSAVEAAVGEAAVASLSACGILIHSDVPDLPSKHSYASMQVYPLVVPGGQPSMLLLCTDWDAVDPLVDAVMPVGVDSLQLALAMPPVASCLAGKRVLDVCCGCGIQGLAAAARGARFVLLSDLSPRAIHFARLNARLNQLNASVVGAEPGSGYTPAKRHLSMTRDLPFDLVLCNPPFVAVPSRLKLDPALYVAGGDDGAELVRSFLDDAPRILCPLAVSCSSRSSQTSTKRTSGCYERVMTMRARHSRKGLSCASPTIRVTP